MSRIILPPYHFASPPPPPPIILPPGICFMIYTIYPCPVSFCTLDSFCPHIILPPGHGLMIYTIYLCPVSFCHCIRLRFHTNKKPFTTKAYDRRASGDCGTSGSLSSQLLHPCMDLNETWQGCCITSLEVHVGVKFMFFKYCRSYGP